MNNKGFAITTVLYGTFLLFLLLIVTMLAIVANYKDKMELLIDHNNGARSIVNVYKKDAYLMTIDGRKYYKENPGLAMIGYVYDGGYTGPLLISKDPEAVVYSTDCTISECANRCGLNSSKTRTVCKSTKFVEYNNTKYYYSSVELWRPGNKTASATNKVSKYDSSLGKTLEAVVKEVLKQNVKYYGIATAT